MACRLSVITPVLNGARHLDDCLRSVCEQHCPGVEHIIIDGGSTDGTLAIIQRWAAQHPHIRWVSEPDRGQSDAMNKGLVMATGTIVGILNADDWYAPGALTEALEQFRTLPCPTLLVGNCEVRDGDGRLLHVNRPRHVGLLPLLMLYVPAFPANPAAYFYHRALHDTIGPYDVHDHFGMDVDFLFRAARTAHVAYRDRVWGCYRYRPGTKTYDDVAAGRNRDRVTAIADRYRSTSPFLHRLASSLFISLVQAGKRLRRPKG